MSLSNFLSKILDSILLTTVNTDIMINKASEGLYVQLDEKL